MKINQKIGINTGDASLNINSDKACKKKKPQTDTASGIYPPYPHEALSDYLTRSGIDVPYLKDLLRIYTSYMREQEASLLLDLVGVEEMIAAIRRGDTIEATEIFVSFCLKSTN